MMLWMMSCLPTLAQAPMDGGVWKDNTGKHINAHGGNQAATSRVVASSSALRCSTTRRPRSSSCGSISN